MDQEIIMNRVNTLLDIIIDLEREEQECISLFIVPSTYLNESHCQDPKEKWRLFNGQGCFQDERYRLNTVRQQIYDCSVALVSFLTDLEKIQGQQNVVARARTLRQTMGQTMKARREGLLLEVVSYKNYGYLINEVHVKLNGGLAHNISHAFC
ncbi:MAG: hypothetical protein J3R72DRAFT_494331 [Linnemannia gamsii]|nr:MAG: hypothetical protein J3R72DRAFT_494331 [Linnemannia gamsii]